MRSDCIIDNRSHENFWERQLQKAFLFAANGNVDFIWQDDRLKWDPELCGELNETILSSRYIWTPGLRLLNIADQYDNEIIYFYTDCRVRSDGLVKCSPVTNLRSPCTAKLQFGNQRTKDAVRYKTKTPMLHDVKPIKIVQENVLNSEVQLRLTVNIKRNGSSLSLAIVHLCVILSVFTTICLLLNVRDGLRLQMNVYR
ncbi:uncharacterized protein LOC119189293 [Manduca sexta]|uniref:uncharacterized protein LOC119189293 n=1 Tax=Manduca sexta TaxID=7130 RepID=UPI00189051FA|nr:uncharacterized protein LOC119189293 [Manduca sexta]